MNTESILKSIGLHASEISVYIFLLENGPSLLQDVSRETKIGRTNCYNVLNSLKEKNLIFELSQDAPKIYSAYEPESLISYVETKRNSVKSLVADLHLRQFKSSHKPKFDFSLGVNSLKNLLLSTFTARNVFSVGLNELLKLNGIVLLEWFVRETTARTITHFDIPSGEPRSAIVVYNNSVSFVEVTNDVYISTLTNPHIAKQMIGLIKNQR